jgi:hypothetical protein
MGCGASSPKRSAAPESAPPHEDAENAPGHKAMLEQRRRADTTGSGLGLPAYITTMPEAHADDPPRRVCRFSRVDESTEILEGGLAIKKTRRSNGFSLASPELRGGAGCSASATFRIDYDPEGSSNSFGVFQADMELDRTGKAAEGKRCALVVGQWDDSGYAQVLCDEEKLEKHEGFGAWEQNDTLEVSLTFESSTSARAIFSFKGQTLTQQLEDLPRCGLCLGAGLQRKHDRATLVASSIETEFVQRVDV